MKFTTDMIYDNNVDDVLTDPENMVTRIIQPRSDLIKDGEFKLTKREFIAEYSNRPFVWMRTPGIEDTEIVFDDDGLIWYKTPMRSREATCKFGSRFILDVGTLGCGFWYSSPAIKKAAAFVDDHKNIENPDSKEFLINSLLVKNVLKAPYTALVNILKPKTDERIRILGNDVAIGRKKIMGADELVNNSGVYMAVGVNHSYNDEFFKEILNEDEYHRSTRAGITGIENEIPGYGRQEFTEEYFDEIKKLIAEAEKYIYD